MKEWLGETVCDICHKDIKEELYDAGTNLGPWATMCKKCWTKYRKSPKLGIGYGQKYVEKEGKWIKVES